LNLQLAEDLNDYEKYRSGVGYRTFKKGIIPRFNLEGNTGTFYTHMIIYLLVLYSLMHLSSFQLDMVHSGDEETSETELSHTPISIV